MKLPPPYRKPATEASTAPSERPTPKSEMASAEEERVQTVKQQQEETDGRPEAD
jgi:hypothetical protein